MTEERAHYWSHPALPAVDLLDARYVRHTFGKHTHDTYVIAAITSGVETFRYRGAVEVVPAGSLALVDPDTAHTGQAGIPEGWSYRVLYPSVASMTSVAEELGVRSGTPGFRAAVSVDDELTRLVRQVHAAAERDQPLAASTLLRLALARTIGAHTTARRPGPRPPAAGQRAAELARDLLAARITDPPTLEQLAAATGARPFPLLRAFRSAYGLPPHAWLTQHRVTAARQLLDAGTAPADAAVSVGFVDQAHLTRHFRRIIGVPPGAYRRASAAARGTAPERRNVQEPGR